MLIYAMGINYQPSQKPMGTGEKVHGLVLLVCDLNMFGHTLLSTPPLPPPTLLPA